LFTVNGFVLFFSHLRRRTIKLSAHKQVSKVIWQKPHRCLGNTMVLWTQWVSLQKRHLNRFSRYCTAQPCAKHTYTYRHTDHATCDICSSKPHVMHMCRRCDL